jgi:hypothetical protein
MKELKEHEESEGRAGARAEDSTSAMKEGANSHRSLPCVSPALAFKAEWINSKHSVPGTLCTPHEVDQLVVLGLVSRERAREVGLG